MRLGSALCGALALCLTVPGTSAHRSISRLLCGLCGFPQRADNLFRHGLDRGEDFPEVGHPRSGVRGSGSAGISRSGHALLRGDGGRIPNTVLIALL
jgi:hypothetical protein